MSEVLVIGALHLDVIVDAPRLPALDETLVGASVTYAFGGKGGNQAVAAARMGADVAMAGRVGHDRFAEQILAALDEAGVDRAQVVAGSGESGMSVAIVDDAGSYGAVIVSGVNREIDGDAVALPDDLRVVLMQNEVPEEVNLAVARRLPSDVLLVLNAAPAREVAAELLARVDILVVNTVEARQIAGVGSEADIAERLRAMGPGAVLLTLGADGFVACDEDGVTSVAAHPVGVVSTHGAGDMFVGALAAELARGATLVDAARFANAAAAIHVSAAVPARAAITADAVHLFQSVNR